MSVAGGGRREIHTRSLLQLARFLYLPVLRTIPSRDELVTGDPEFNTLERELKIAWLK